MSKEQVIKEKKIPYTYIVFGEDAIKLANGEEIADLEKFIKKANDLITTNENKKLYNETKPRKSSAKGASEETLAKAELIKSVLQTDKGLTYKEINELINQNFSPLEISNSVKYIENAESRKELRAIEKISKAGNVTIEQKEYTCYYLV